MSTTRDRATLGKVHELVDKLDDNSSQQSVRESLWRDAGAALQQYPKDSAQMNYISRTLEENGVLPRLLFDIADGTGKADPIDKNHDNYYSKSELVTASNSNDKVIAMTAQYALKNYDQINTNHERYADKGLSEQEISKWRGDHPGEKTPDETAPYDHNTERKQSKQELESQLNDPHSTPQERLDAVQKLAADQKRVTLVDANGQSHEYELQTKDLGNGRTMVHLWDMETGKIVLRGIGKDGEYTEEAGAKFQGDEFSAQYGHRSVVADSKY